MPEAGSTSSFWTENIFPSLACSSQPAAQPWDFGDEGWGSPEMVGEYTGYAMHNSVVVVFRCGWLACGARGRFCCLPFGRLSRDRERSRVNVPAFQVPATICPGFWCILTSCQVAAGIVLLKIWSVLCWIFQALIAIFSFICKIKPRRISFLKKFGRRTALSKV